MRSNKKLIVAISAIILLVLGVVGATYAWFQANVSGNTNASSVVVQSGTLSLEYINGQEVKGENILPGWSQEKEFTVENKGENDVYYKIEWENLTNTFVNKSDLTYTITGTTNGSNQASNLTQREVPASGTNIAVLENIKISSGETHTYRMNVSYANRNADQSSDTGKILTGKIAIKESENSNIEYNLPQNYTMLFDETLGNILDENNIPINEIGDITGGWYNPNHNPAWGNGTLENNGNNMVLTAQNLNQMAEARTTNNVNLSGYKEIIFDINMQYQEGTYSMYWFQYMFQNSNLLQSDALTENFTGVKKFDVSSISSLGYVTLGTRIHQTGKINKLYLYNIALIKEDDFSSWISLAGLSTQIYPTLESVLNNNQAMDTILSSQNAVNYMISCSGTIMIGILENDNAWGLIDQNIKQRMQQNYNWSKFANIYDRNLL